METGKSYVLQNGKLLVEGVSKEEHEAKFPVAVADGGTGATTAEQARTNLSAAASSHTHNVEDIKQLYQGFSIHEFYYTVNLTVPGNSFFNVDADINVSGIPMYMLGYEVYISAGGEEALSAYFAPTHMMLSVYSNYKKIECHFQNTSSSSLYVSRVKFKLTYIND